MRRLLRPLIGIAIAAALLVALFLLVLGPRRVVSGFRTPLLRTPAEIGVESWEEVEFSPPDQDIFLRTWWMPAADATAAVVVVHGGGGNKSSPWGRIPELCRDLAARGYSALALDMRNHGASHASRNGRPTFGIDEANDVIGGPLGTELKATYSPNSAKYDSSAVLMAESIILGSDETGA